MFDREKRAQLLKEVETLWGMECPSLINFVGGYLKVRFTNLIEWRAGRDPRIFYSAPSLSPPLPNPNEYEAAAAAVAAARQLHMLIGRTAVVCVERRENDPPPPREAPLRWMMVGGLMGAGAKFARENPSAVHGGATAYSASVYILI